MTAEYSSLAPEGGQGGWRTGRGVKTFSSHCATVLITLLVVTGWSSLSSLLPPASVNTSSSPPLHGDRRAGQVECEDCPGGHSSLAVESRHGNIRVLE